MLRSAGCQADLTAVMVFQQHQYPDQKKNTEKQNHNSQQHKYQELRNKKWIFLMVDIKYMHLWSSKCTV